MLKSDVLAPRFLTSRLSQHRALAESMYLHRIFPPPQKKKRRRFSTIRPSWSSSPFFRQGLIFVYHCSSKTDSSTILVTLIQANASHFVILGCKTDRDILLFPSPHHVFSSRLLPWDLYAFKINNSSPSTLPLDTTTQNLETSSSLP